MKKVLGLVGLLSLVSSIGWGQNVVFNPGFDMIPWDTGWTIETDTSSSGGASNCSLWTYVEVKPATGSSLPNCCYLKTNVGMEAGGGFGSGTVRGEANVWQTFNEITNCIVKVMVKYYWNWVATGDSPENKAELQVQVNNVWNTVWEKVPDSYNGGDTVWSEVDTMVYGSVTGIRFYVISYLSSYSFTGGMWARFHFWVDDVYVGEVGVEESEKLKVKSERLEVCPNPFVKSTIVRFEDTRIKDYKIQAYDMVGRLVEELNSEVIGRDLPSGIYFLKVKGYKPIRITKIGGVK